MYLQFLHGLSATETVSRHQQNYYNLFNISQLLHIYFVFISSQRSEEMPLMSTRPRRHKLHANFPIFLTLSIKTCRWSCNNNNDLLRQNRVYRQIKRWFWYEEKFTQLKRDEAYITKLWKFCENHCRNGRIHT